MNKRTKEELKELMYIFGTVILSSILVVQCNSGMSALISPDCRESKKEKTSIQADSTWTKVSLVHDDLYRAHKVKSR